MWLRMQFAWLQFACNNNKMGPSVASSGIKEDFFEFFDLNSSSDSSTPVYPCLVIRLHSSTFVYIRL